jgi:putative aldouronate transport system permease protein
MAAIRESRGDRIFNGIVLVLVTIALLIVLYPLIYILSCSISDANFVAKGEIWLLPKGVNLRGYARVFQDPDILTGYANTIFYTVFGTLLNLALTLTAGYALSKKTLPGRRYLMLFVLFTMYFSGGLIPTYLLVKNLKLLDSRLVLLILGAVSVYNLIVARTFFQGIPSELEEAATIDGCSTYRLFWSIVLPLSKALMSVMVLYYGVAHWNSYFSALIYISDDAKKPLQIFLRRILILEQLSTDMVDSQSAEMMYEAEQLKLLLKYSVIVVSSLPVLIIYPFLQKYFDKGVLLGSLKG